VSATKYSRGKLVWTVAREEGGKKGDFEIELTCEQNSARAFWAEIDRIVHKYVQSLLNATDDYFPESELHMWDPFTPHGTEERAQPPAAGIVGENAAQPVRNVAGRPA